MMNHQIVKWRGQNSSCYTQTKIDIYFLSFCIRHTWGGGLAGLLCLSHISAAECQCFLWPSSKDLPIFPKISPYAWFFCTLLFGLHFGDLFFHIFFCCTAVEQHWIICSEEIIRPFTSIVDCTLNATFSVLCPYKMWSKIDYRGSTERPYFMHPSARNSVFLPPHHATALIKKMLTPNLTRTSHL